MIACSAPSQVRPTRTSPLSSIFLHTNDVALDSSGLSTFSGPIGVVTLPSARCSEDPMPMQVRVLYIPLSHGLLLRNSYGEQRLLVLSGLSDPGNVSCAALLPVPLVSPCKTGISSCRRWGRCSAPHWAWDGTLPSCWQVTSLSKRQSSPRPGLQAHGHNVRIRLVRRLCALRQVRRLRCRSSAAAPRRCGAFLNGTI